ncbi:MAG: 50S ribosomal protein L3 N(5)-glutamine methyltransferase [Nevskia sp.]|nr:50S ribosomal protein L3 N(5)-glutamine methyltransferase [Nevskia sp.]
MTDETHALDALRTVRDLIRWGASRFNEAGLVFGHGTDNALDEAFHLVLWSLHLPFDLPAVYLESALTAAERSAALKLLQERVRTRKPAAYLTGEAWFAGLAFAVDERVLVPRSPIAELIGARFAPWLAGEPQTILDLCAGSGCIGIACAHAFEQASVDLAEIDAGAIELIQRNIARHGVAERVRAVHGDLFGPLRGRRYDLVVSNPPYVPAREWEALAPEFKQEPRIALDGGADGMDVVERILRQAPAHLTPHGLLVCEIGGSQDEFEARFPRIPVAWPDFEHGGDGVFLIGAAELRGWLRAQDKAR